MKLSDVTAVILTKNEERRLPRTLASLPAAMPVLILDAESSDGTQRIAREYGARLLVRAWSDFVDARRFALAQVTTAWAFFVDADEVLDESLRAAIADAREDLDGYLVRRDTSFGGRPLRMWSGERLLRCFRVDAVRVESFPTAGGSAALHERFICDGSIGELPGVLQHDSYADAAEYRRKFARYTEIEARGLPRSFSRAARESLLVAWRLAKFGLLRGALLDGPRGWYVMWWSALYPTVVAW
ncbi:MAG: glycosyltransferase family 2 protein, partial [Candidatus Eremiobacteraeota bacterium]|nr:glycosyltransferase family 2 protein [Candidatus Eremiobacteraeota bacterium]